MSSPDPSEVTVGVVGTKIYTRDCMVEFERSGIEIDNLITLTPEQANANAVAGYHDLRELATRGGIDVYHPEEYGLETDRDQAALQEMGLDLLLVCGWSRLIPEAVLKSLSVGALGAHGSPEGLPKGRGRAVLNWALIEQESRFRLSTFFLEPGVDDGEILETTTFEITDFDTASTLRYKTWLAYSAAVIDNFGDVVAETVETTPQPSNGATYYPKREPQDGGIDWQQTTDQIHAFVRALTEPYPGAFTWLDGHRVTIWETQPFDNRMALSKGTPGRIVKVFCDGELLVETADSTILLTEYEGIEASDVEPDDQFTSADSEAQLAEIRSRYPDFVADEQKEI